MPQRGTGAVIRMYITIIVTSAKVLCCELRVPLGGDRDSSIPHKFAPLSTSCFNSSPRHTIVTPSETAEDSVEIPALISGLKGKLLSPISCSQVKYLFCTRLTITHAISLLTPPSPTIIPS